MKKRSSGRTFVRIGTLLLPLGVVLIVVWVFVSGIQDAEQRLEHYCDRVAALETIAVARDLAERLQLDVSANSDDGKLIVTGSYWRFSTGSFCLVNDVEGATGSISYNPWYH